MIRVYCNFPNVNDGTSFYRGAGPLTSLQRQGKVELITAPDLDWPVLKYADILFFQRPGGEEQVKVIEKAKRAGKRVWIDYDDLLTQMPDSNPTISIYGLPEVKNSIFRCLELADIVSVSTQALADAWAANINGKCVVIPNAWDDDLFPHPVIDFGKSACSKRLLWRGSRTHDEDLLSVMMSLEHIARNESTAEWYFLGDPFWMVLRTIRRHRNINIKGFSDIIEYFHTLKTTYPDLMLVPLDNNPFNKAKSNIAWLEATWAGGLTIAPDWPEWQKPGVLNYTNNFKDLVKAVIRNEIDSLKLHAESWSYIQDNLLLSKVNQLRLDILTM